MKYQKILAMVCLIIAALAIVLSLAFSSGILYAVGQSSVSEMGINSNPLKDYASKANDILLIMSIILLLAVVLLYIMQCTKRRNYYISNYVAIGIFAAYAFAYVIAVIVIVAKCFALMGGINFDKWWSTEHSEDFLYTAQYTKNCTTLALFIVLAVLVIAEIVAWILNLLWKIKLMKGEKELLEKGAAPKTAEMEVA